MRGLVAPLLLASACASASVPDGGSPPDARTPGPDAGEPSGRDAGPGPELAPGLDVEPGSDVAPGLDVAPGPDAGAPAASCSDPNTLSGLAWGGITTRVLLPDSAAPVTVTRIEETPPFVAGAASRVVGTTAPWTAQISHLTMFDAIDYAHAVVDPADGAVYVATEQQMQRDGLEMRFYDGAGGAPIVFTRDGAPGRDMVGAQRQSNFFVSRYDADGRLAWVSRLGPNTANTDRAGHIVGFGLTPTGVRVVAQVEGATQLVVGPGTPGQRTYDAPNATAFWAELSRVDGAYVADSLRVIAATAPRDGASNLTASGYMAHAANGETAIGGALFRGSGTVTFTVGAGGPDVLTVTSTFTRAVFAKIMANGTVPFLGTIDATSGGRSSAEPRAVGISPAGDVVGGGQFNAVAGAVVARGGVGAPITFSHVASESFLAAWSPTGGLSWARAIGGRGRNVVSRIMVTGDAVYVMGTHATGEVLGAGEPTEVTLRVTGYTLSKYDLATGAFEWVRTFTNAAGNGAADAYDVWAVPGRLVVPATNATVVRVVGGDVDRRFERAGLLAISLDADGDVLGCETVATGAFRMRVFEP